MQSRTVRILGAAACIAVVFTLSGVADEPAITSLEGAALTASEVSPAAISTAQLDFDPPVPIGADAKLHRVQVTRRRDGTTVQLTGVVSQGEMDCLDAENSVYCNTVGAFVFGLSGTSATARFSDDIVTASRASGVPGTGCRLDRYVIRVTGDKNQDGSGAALGGYRVDYALYDSCPGANSAPRVIAGTAGFADIAPEDAAAIVEVEHLIPGFQDVFLPSNEMFLGISFSRAKCGSVVGAPALKGFSGDQLDVPGTPCDAALGGFPGFAHASFYAEVYVRPGCGETFVGYRNSNHNKATISAGAGVRFADDIVLPLDCNLVAYEVAFKQAGIEVDIRTDLSSTDPDDGFVIPGTSDQFLNCFGCDVQIGHVDVDPPQQLFAGQRYWVAFKSTSNTLGPVRTCKPSVIGETSDFYSVYNSSIGAWEVRAGSVNCLDGFDVTLYCEGAAPPGACCDMQLTECVGGPNEGEPCTNNVRCAPGLCESVCRNVPRGNCTADAINAPILWRAGKRCGPVCTSGPAFGEDCVVDADCVVCNGGSRAGDQCCPGGTCNGVLDVCRAHPDEPCTTDVNCRFCDGGTRDTLACPGGDDAECPDGTCDTSDTCNTVPTCVEGSRDGLECCPFGGCQGGTCAGPTCSGGTRPGQTCTREADCPGGSCVNTPFQQSCGEAACCQPGDIEGEDRPVCADLTLHECNAIPPPGARRVFQKGKTCGDEGQECPLIACLTRSGDCTLARQATCNGGERDGEDCEILAAPPGECTTNFGLGISCGGDCVGGINDGKLCDPLQNNPCEGGLCPQGECVPAFCRGLPGCDNDFCCTDICLRPGQFFCCTVHWDETCATDAIAFCERQRPSNDDCFSSDRGKGSILLEIPDTIEGSSVSATAGLDPGFCCHEEDPGAQGVGTLWYKFVATHTSARITTCRSDAHSSDGISYRAEDSLISVYSVGDPTRGICTNQTVCDLELQNCDDESVCVPDERAACDTLSPVACNDNSDCGNFAQRAELCVANLVVGQLYYLQVAGKSNEPDLDNPNIIRGSGRWKIEITAPCTSRSSPMTNDACSDGQALTGGDLEPLVIPFDLSGQKLGVCTNGDNCVVGAPFACGDGSSCRTQDGATFDCPGPPFECDFGTIKNDIWYEWIAPITGEATIDTCGLDPNTGFQTQTGLVVYEGCDCPADDARIHIQSIFFPGIPPALACSWFAVGACLGGSEVFIPIEEGVCYRLRLGGSAGEEPSGELHIVAQPYCGNGRINFELPEECDSGAGCLPDCTCEPGWQPTPFFPSVNCVPVCGDGIMKSGEACDDGNNDSCDGCSAFCVIETCGDNVVCEALGEECDGGTTCDSNCLCEPPAVPTVPPSRDCVNVVLTGTEPACDVSLTRPSNSVIRLTFNAPIPAPVTFADLQIHEITNGGVIGPDISNLFNFTVGPSGDVLKISEDGTTGFANEKWYAVMNTGAWTGVANFEVDYRVVFGDANNTGRTSFTDLAAINANIRNPTTDSDLYDINASGFVSFTDLAAANSFIGSEAQSPKPDGHSCTVP